MDPSSLCSSSDAAMSIMEKYQSLMSGIEEARRETTQLQEEKENFTNEIEKLYADRSHMEAEEQNAREESAALQEKIKKVLEEKNFSSSSDLLTERNYQRRRVEFLKNYMAEQRRNFWEESRQFRSAIKRLKLASTEVGLDTTISHAFLIANDVLVEHNDDNNKSVADENNYEDHESLTVEELEERWHKEAMEVVLSPSPKEEDLYHCNLEIHQARLRYQRAFRAREKSEHGFNEAMVIHEKARNCSMKRQEKKDKLQAQLNRIRQDIQELEKERGEIKEQTLETKAITESYRKGATDKKNLILSRSLKQVPKSGSEPRKRNPYAIFQPCSKQVKRDHRTAVKRQHPHLAGRIRMDRQFGVASIGIIGGDDVTPPMIDETNCDEDSDDDISDFVPFRRR